MKGVGGFRRVIRGMDRVFDGRLIQSTRDFISTRDVVILGVLLAMVQAVDGILTNVGINRFGLGVEGNPLLRELMVQFGHAETLTLVKGLAIFIVIALTYIAHRLPWVKNAMGAVTCIYLAAAILPWTYILFLRPGM